MDFIFFIVSLIYFVSSFKILNGLEQWICWNHNNWFISKNHQCWTHVKWLNESKFESPKWAEKSDLKSRIMKKVSVLNHRKICIAYSKCKFICTFPFHIKIFAQLGLSNSPCNVMSNDVTGRWTLYSFSGINQCGLWYKMNNLQGAIGCCLINSSEVLNARGLKALCIKYTSLEFIRQQHIPHCRLFI